MSEDTGKITQLCTSWWDELAHASKAEQQRYAKEFLSLLGWGQPLPFTTKEAAAQFGALPYVLRAGGQTAIAVYFVMPGALKPPSAVVEAGLDFCPATRVLTDEARELSVSYLLVTDLQRTYLYDVRTAELILYADDPRTFNQTCGPALIKSNVERGSLEEIRREPRSVVARHLREWRQRWTHAIAREGGMAEETACIVMDRLTLVRYLFDRDILRRTKWRLEKRFMELVAAAESDRPGVGKQLVTLFHDMWFDWRIDLFAGQPVIDQVLADDRLAGSLLREFVLLSRSKFSIATVLESFNYGDPREKMRVRMVPDVNEEREQYLSKQTVATVDRARLYLDVVDEGYRAIFHWFDKIVAVYERLEVDFDSETGRQAPHHEDMDLFTWSELDATRPGACSDKIGYTCEQGLRIYYTDPHHLRVARLLLTMHLVSRYHQASMPINTFPPVAPVFEERPANLDAAHLMMRPADNPEEQVP